MWDEVPPEKILRQLSEAIKAFGTATQFNSHDSVLVSKSLYNALVRSSMTKRQFRRWRGKRKSPRRGNAPQVKPKKWLQHSDIVREAVTVEEFFVGP